MNKSEVKIYPHLYPKPIALIGAVVNEKPNFLTIGDVMTSGYQKPRFIISSGKNHYTNKGIIDNKAFSVNIPSTNDLIKTDYCGLVSGLKEDKSEIFEVYYGNKVKSAPLIREFPINHACILIKTIDFGDTHYLFIGEIMETYINDSCLDKKKLNIEKLSPISYCSSDNDYRRIGEIIGKGYREGKSFER